MMNRLRTYASFVRFSHSAFALPFALVGALLASRYVPVTVGRVGWVVAAMVAARSAAMGFNRLVDARHDALNPRTAAREMPRGAISRTQAVTFVAGWSLAFVAVTSQISMLCFALSPVALAIVFWYSLAKRYTTYAQLFLGLAMAVAPVGGWIAAGGPLRAEPFLLAVAIGAWVGGFDVLYACQDLEFDRRHGLRSIPVGFGVRRALWIARGMHVVTVVALGVLAAVTDLGPVYLGGVGAVAALLVYEQSLVCADDLSRLKQAFDLNGYVGVLYLVTTAVAVYVG
ncbi:MAG TPA: 4-hydroxybenzoate octaprenyltransferase [Acidobacteria bacterium]|jgi:4-hydroxybenzoate polyprenyltransferase|nr:4-hydroxybenzoate octaprenyltransferase [Acidobacteriota bacterium]HAK54230.1 4-hydroxybenzoate octaprenyltransferase [Acidobacteriota bacterium]|tara:strand:+ start:5365 stop:6219 length:855 start_codon:yes stop_codon:yes gene_type:complete